MAQVDWLPTMQDDLEDNEAIVAVVTSADIDSIAIHLFSISIWQLMRFATFFNAVTGGIHDFGCRCGFPGGFNKSSQLYIKMYIQTLFCPNSR
jgi:hypothetical protein